ncbi:MAG: NTP transferase domain-containing protein, partial [Patescibacteria group bacterium]
MIRTTDYGLLTTDLGIVILAAGKGTRLNCIDRPKVMLEIGGKPIVSYIVET